MESTFKEDEMLWKIVKMRMNTSNFVVENHIESFNNFINYDISNILENKEHLIHLYNFNNYIYKNILEIENIKITNPNTIQNNNEYELFYKDAILNNLTYESSIYVTISNKLKKISIYDKKETISIIDKKEILLTKIPIMLKSNLCYLSQNNKKSNLSRNLKFENIKLNNDKDEIGGYFIINGKEKVYVNQERLCYNRNYLFKRIINEKKVRINEIFSYNRINYNLFNFKIYLHENNIFTVKMNLFTKNVNVPILLLLNLLGFQDNIEIFNYIKNKNHEKMYSKYKFTLFNYNGLLNQKYEYIHDNYKYNSNTIYKLLLQYLNNNELQKINNITNNEIMMYINNYLKNDLLPHLGSDLNKKGVYICNMINELILFDLEIFKESDRDSYFNKRLLNCNDILKFMFNYSFNLMKNECIQEFNKRIENNIQNITSPESAINLLNKDTLYSTFIKLFTVGEIVLLNLSGVFQSIKGDSHLDKINHLRTLKTSIGNKSSTGKILEPRYTHNSQFGYICCVETPEGKQVGLVKTFSILTKSTIESNIHKKNLYTKISDLYISFNKINHINCYKYNILYIDGNLVGYLEDSFKFVEKFIKMRRSKLIYYQYSIYLDYNTLNVYINIDSGRLIRPLLIVENNKINLKFEKINQFNSFDELLKENMIEYLEIQESYNMLISLNYGYIRRNNNLKKMSKEKNNNPYHYANYHLKTYTHCEIHPLTLLGISANCLIFLDHNQAPKNTSTCKYIKQAIGIYNRNFRDRFDVNSFILTYPQKPLIESKMHSIVNIDKIPTGQNIILAICCYSGFNQEDSVIINKKSIERGLFKIFNYTSYIATLKSNANNRQQEKFIRPDSKYNKIKKKVNYNKLNLDGFIEKETFVNKFDAIIGKISPLIGDETNDVSYIDTSVVLKNEEFGIIDKVVTNIFDSEENEICKVRIRNERKPNVGDKFSNRSGQKYTVGLILDQEDMPFTKNGLTPDIIMNPHAIPTRCSMGQFIEGLLAKLCAIEGHFTDGSNFSKIDINNVGNLLEKYGFNKSGTEKLRCGYTGKMLESDIYIGPLYNFRLRHMSQDKIQMRSNVGPLGYITRQPPKGRNRGGAVKIGNMETDCLVGHGLSQFIQEKFVETLEKYTYPICNKCGIIANKVIDLDLYKCPLCDSNTNISNINIPYNFKLLQQELLSLKIKTAFELE